MIAILLTLLACTENQRSKTFGGNMEVRIPCDQVVFDVTWKEDNLWYAIQPAAPGWTPATKVFRESSSFGLIQGEVTMIESRCGAN